jgi:hypothetical protein
LKIVQLLTRYSEIRCIRLFINLADFIKGNNKIIKEENKALQASIENSLKTLWEPPTRQFYPYFPAFEPPTAYLIIMGQTSTNLHWLALG